MLTELQISKLLVWSSFRYSGSPKWTWLSQWVGLNGLQAAQQESRAHCSLHFCSFQELHFKNRYWHDSCFRCFKCSTSLVNEPFMLRENNKVWCSNCTAAEDAPRCKGCFKPIIAGIGTREGVQLPNSALGRFIQPWRLCLGVRASRWKAGAPPNGTTSDCCSHLFVHLYLGVERLLCSYPSRGRLTLAVNLKPLLPKALLCKSRSSSQKGSGTCLTNGLTEGRRPWLKSDTTDSS